MFKYCHNLALELCRSQYWGLDFLTSSIPFGRRNVAYIFLINKMCIIKGLSCLYQGEASHSLNWLKMAMKGTVNTYAKYDLLVRLLSWRPPLYILDQLKQTELFPWWFYFIVQQIGDQMSGYQISGGLSVPGTNCPGLTSRVRTVRVRTVMEPLPYSWGSISRTEGENRSLGKIFVSLTS